MMRRIVACRVQRGTGQARREKLSRKKEEEDVRKLVAAVAILAVVFMVGCQDTKKVTELQGTVDTQMQKITELEGQVQKLTVERDSLAKVIIDMTAKTGGKTTGKTTGKATGGQTGGGGTGTKPTRGGR